MTEACRNNPFWRSLLRVWTGAILLAACEPSLHGQPAQKPAEPGVRSATYEGPEDAPEGSCWGRIVSPAVIETVTEQVQVSPARYHPDGSIAAQAVYASQSQQKIVTPRQDHWFETPCAEVLTPDFIASLQRALAVRRYYEGPVNGKLDRTTQAGIRLFQRNKGIDSPVLSLATARELGLIAVPRDLLE